MACPAWYSTYSIRITPALELACNNIAHNHNNFLQAKRQLHDPSEVLRLTVSKKMTTCEVTSFRMQACEYAPQDGGPQDAT